MRYSNIGFGLLGRVLGLAAGKPYKELVLERVCGPLGMLDTVAEPEDAPDGRLATGHNRRRRPVAPFRIPTLGGAGVLRSSGRDMLTYLGAQLDPGSTPLDEAIELTQRRHVMIRGKRLGMGLAWLLLTTRGGATIHRHNGGTMGMGAFAGFDRAAGTAVVALYTSPHKMRIDRAAFRALERLAN